jgi:hypothetical protein
MTAEHARVAYASLVNERPGGSTALYDAILQAVILCLQLYSAGNQDDFYQVLLLTDGEDTSSRSLPGQVEDVLRRMSQVVSFCNFFFVGVDIPFQHRVTLERFAVVGNRAKYLDVSGADGISEMFQRICLSLHRRTMIISE